MNPRKSQIEELLSKTPRGFTVQARSPFDQAFAFARTTIVAPGQETAGVQVKFQRAGWVTGVSIAVLNTTTPSLSDGTAVRVNSSFKLTSGPEQAQLVTNGERGIYGNVQAVIGPTGGTAPLLVPVAQNDVWNFYAKNDISAGDSIQFQCVLFFAGIDSPLLIET